MESRHSGGKRRARSNGVRAAVETTSSAAALGFLYGLLIVCCVSIVLALAIVALMYFRSRNFRMDPPYESKQRASEFPFRTGDLVVTSHRTGRRQRGPLVVDTSTLIKCATASPYNHLAVIYVDPTTRQVLFWDMTVTGPRLATVQDMIDGPPDQDVFVRPLLGPRVSTRLFERCMVEQSRHLIEYTRCFVNGFWRCVLPKAPLHVPEACGKARSCQPSREPRSMTDRDADTASLCHQRRCRMTTHADRRHRRRRRRLRKIDAQTKRTCADGGLMPPIQPPYADGDIHDMLAPRTQRRFPARTCSHFVIEIYHLLGIIEYDPDRSYVHPSRVFPCDLITDPIDPGVVPFARPYSLGPLVKIEP